MLRRNFLGASLSGLVTLIGCRTKPKINVTKKYIHLARRTTHFQIKLKKADEFKTEDCLCIAFPVNKNLSEQEINKFLNFDIYNYINPSWKDPHVFIFTKTIDGVKGINNMIVWDGPTIGPYNVDVTDWCIYKSPHYEFSKTVDEV